MTRVKWAGLKNALVYQAESSIQDLGKEEKMRKGPLALIVVVLALSVEAFAFQNEPDGFRGVKWGDPPGEDMELFAEFKDANVRWYEKKNDKLEIERARVERIVYGFYKNRFWMVRVVADYDYRFLYGVIMDKFGSEWQKFVYKRGVAYKWSGDIAEVHLWWKNPQGGLDIFSIKINNQYQEGIRREEEEEESRRKADPIIYCWGKTGEGRLIWEKTAKSKVDFPEGSGLPPKAISPVKKGIPYGGEGEGLRGEGVRIKAPIGEREIERSIEPDYPEWAQKQGIEGKVEVKCWVLPSGEVSKVEILLTSGWPELDECARQALMKWEFSPIEGEEIQWGIVTFEFELR